MIRFSLFFGLILLALESPCAAATIRSVKLVMDGSTDPPGDRIDLQITFANGEQQVTIEVTANERIPNENRVVSVRARGKQGAFRTFLKVASPQQGGLRFASIVIPYSQLLLKRGEHQIGYEVRAIVDGKPQEIAATRLTRMIILDKPRTTIVEKTSQFQRSMSPKKTTVYRLDGGVPRVEEVTLQRSEYTFSGGERTVSVNIPGGYLRHEISGGRGSSNAPRAFVPLKSLAGKPERLVYFATNRAKDKSRHYGDQASPRVAWGRCLVNIPVTSHQRGTLELPEKPRNWWQPVSGDFRKKYFHIETLDEMSFDSLRGEFSRGDVLLYVHGFANTFSDAVLRAAQIRHDIEFRGAVAAFTWPADADMKRITDRVYIEKQYRLREADAEQSVPKLVEVLRRLVHEQRTKGAGHKIYIIAHSLGCRVLIKAVSALQTSNFFDGKLNQILGHIVLAAPDVDWPTFALHGPKLVAACQRMTYYYSTHDLPLMLSQVIHNIPPIGLSPLLHPGVGTINADNANNFSFVFGHGYYSSSNPVLTDLHLILVRDLKPKDRQSPRGSIGNRQTIGPLEHWEFIRKTGTP